MGIFKINYFSTAVFFNEIMQNVIWWNKAFRLFQGYRISLVFIEISPNEKEATTPEIIIVPHL